MSEPIDNEKAHPDLWSIAIRELRENVDYLKLGTRVRLELETVKSQKEIDESLMIMNNVSGLVEGLMGSLQSGIDSMNATMLDIKEMIREAKLLSNEANDRIVEADKKERKLKEMEDTPKYSLGMKIGTGLVAVVVFISGFIAG